MHNFSWRCTEDSDGAPRSRDHTIVREQGLGHYKGHECLVTWLLQPSTRALIAPSLFSRPVMCAMIVQLGFIHIRLHRRAYRSGVRTVLWELSWHRPCRLTSKKYRLARAAGALTPSGRRSLAALCDTMPLAAPPRSDPTMVKSSTTLLNRHAFPLLICYVLGKEMVSLPPLPPRAGHSGE
jgi:hypothetical protein